MTKNFDAYQVSLYSSIDTGRSATIVFYHSNRFVGRIDFMRNTALTTSYFWHPGGASDPAQVYIVLQMSSQDFPVISQLLREEKPWFLSLSGILGTGASSNGYAGALQMTDRERAGEEEGLGG